MKNPSWARFAEAATAPVTVTVAGRVTDAESGTVEVVAFAPPDHWRVADGSLRLRYLANDDGYYQWAGDEAEPARFQPRRPGYWQSGGMQSIELIRPRDLQNPRDDDFTRPIGPVEEIEFLGRTAWEVLLAPPPRKPEPVRQVLDVATGVTLAYLTGDRDSLLQFAAIATGVELPSDAFVLPHGP